MSGTLLQQMWRSDVRRDLRNSAFLSALIYIVPQGIQFVGCPLGMLVLMAIGDGQPWDKHNEPYLWLLAWQFATWMAWFWTLRSRPVLQFALAGPIAVGLTLGPMYWAEFMQQPTTADVAAKHPAEIGSWIHPVAHSAQRASLVVSLKMPLFRRFPYNYIRLQKSTAPASPAICFSA